MSNNVVQIKWIKQWKGTGLTFSVCGTNLKRALLESAAEHVIHGTELASTDPLTAVLQSYYACVTVHSFDKTNSQIP